MRWTIALTLAALSLAGCGRAKPADETTLTFERLEDTTAISRGRPVLASLEPFRMKNGVLRVRGTMEVPDGTRIQLSIYPSGTDQLVGRVQMAVEGRRFESPPMLGERGPLPEGKYRIELLSHFNTMWQPPEVMRATHDGMDLRGPGVTRTRLGDAAFFLTAERRL